MVTIEELQQRLKSRNDLADVAKRAGLTRSYVYALANGTRLNPTYETMEKILKAMEQ